MTPTTVTINRAGLNYAAIPVTAESTVELVQHDRTGANLWYALLVDGTYYDLVMWKHTIGRPQHIEALNQVLSDVQAAISALRTPPTNDRGAIDLDTFQLMTVEGRRQTWTAASEADKRGLALQIIRRQNHGPDEATIALFLAELDARFGPSPMEQAVMGALERLATQEAAAARQARRVGLADDAKFFQRSANAYAKALGYYQQGVRPEALPSGGYTLPSQRMGEAPHLLTLDGDWICTCPSGASMHWAKALIVGIEVAYDDGGQLDTEGTADEAPAPEPAPPAQQTSGADARALAQRIAAARARIAA